MSYGMLMYMKRKHILIMGFAICILAAGVGMYIGRHALFPSQQMKSLRQLEASLDLPEPKYRYEEDAGLNKDSKGALHYDRRIALSYEDISVRNTLRANLLKQGWIEERVASDNPSGYFSFTKGSSDALLCVSGSSQPRDSEGITLNISLKASGEYSCNPAPGV